MLPITTIGVASCIGGSETTCYSAADTIRQSGLNEILDSQGLELLWQDILRQDFLAANKLKELVKINYGIASNTAHLVFNQKPFLVISGDHSSAMGTWAGAQNGLRKHFSPHMMEQLKLVGTRFGTNVGRNIGSYVERNAGRNAGSTSSEPSAAKLALIWLDAHLDAHHLQSSPSGNFHGMPISAMLGQAEPALLNAYPSFDYFAADSLLMYGIRSYEADEKALLDALKVSFYPYKSRVQHELADDLFMQAFLKECHYLIKNCDALGISLDLDILDPSDAPGVETPVPDGVSKKALLRLLTELKQMAGEKLIGVEISEFNPVNDVEQKTEQAIFEIISTLFSP